MVKSTKVPIICICNDRQHTKIRSLANHCFDLRFYKPRVDQIRGAMMSVCYKEGITMSPNALAEIIMASGQDVRQVPYYLHFTFIVVETVYARVEGFTILCEAAVRDDIAHDLACLRQISWFRIHLCEMIE